LRRDEPLKTVKEILHAKGYDVWSTTPNATVFDALTEMARKDVGALTVMEGDQLAGIISERDYARKVILQGKTSRTTLVREIMSSPVVCVRPEQTVEECMALLTGRRIRHLPVIEHDRVIGIISIGDLVKSIISEQQFMIEQLENYISGAHYP
jgi:CBS domain-containing protein